MKRKEIKREYDLHTPYVPSATEDPPHILLAEDDEEMRSLLAQALRRDGIKVTECRDGTQLLDHLGSTLLTPEVLGTAPEEFDLVISDIRMPVVTGLSILEGVRLFDELPPMILITAFGDDETHAKARQLGAAAMFDKPFEIDDLLAKVHELLPHAVQR